MYGFYPWENLDFEKHCRGILIFIQVASLIVLVEGE